MSIIRRKAHSISVTKGNMPPLSTEQRRLVEIFVWYLRQLPKYQEEEGYRSSSWDSADYVVLNKLLLSFMKAKNPGWRERAGDKRYNVWDIPDDDRQEYLWLMKNAATSGDPRAARRLELLEMGRFKKRVLGYIEMYETDREKLGLPPDPQFSRKPATPLEQRASETWEGI